MEEAASSIRVAIIAQEGLALEALLEQWAETALSGVDLCLVAAVPSQDVQTAFYAGRPLAFEAIDDMDFSDVALVLVLEKSAVVEANKDVLNRLHCPILGFMSDLSILEPEPFNPKVEQKAKVLGLAQPAVLAIKKVLQDVRCEAIDVKALYPVSFYGKEGVSELAAQTARLLNAQALEHHVFQSQMPFNYFPMAASLEGQLLEQSLQEQLVQAYDTDDVHATALQMPVFHGVSLLVSVICAEVPDINKLMQYWQLEEDIAYSDSCQTLSNYDLLQLEHRLQLGLVKQSLSDENRLDFWLGFDEAKFGVGKNMITAAEFLLKHHL